MRTISASKNNISNILNAKADTIGLMSSAFDILITYLLCVPINMIRRNLTGINGLSAYFPIPTVKECN